MTSEQMAEGVDAVILEKRSEDMRVEPPVHGEAEEPTGGWMLAATRDTAISRVEAAYNLATGQFVGATWQHAYRGADGSADSRCTLRADCEVCRGAMEAAHLAEGEAKQALEHARAGRWDEAVRCMERIVGPTGYEGRYGATPTWGAMAGAVLAGKLARVPLHLEEGG